MIRVLHINHRDRSVAQRIHAVISLAYAQEARLLRGADFAPMPRTVADIEGSEDFYLGAVRDEDLVGVLSIGPDDEPSNLCISSLVVHPRAQRQGVGTLLLGEALARGPGMAFVVSAATGNAPALALYAKFGFAPYRRGVIGADSLPLAKLRRAA